MEKYIENNRLTVEAEKGKWLTDGMGIFIKKYEFPVGITENEIFHEITEVEYEAIQAEMLEGEVES